jgi:hypothetical protein
MSNHNSQSAAPNALEILQSQSLTMRVQKAGTTR